MKSNIEELNRVLGGGLARGSLTLIGGAPGIGKSTLLLQMANGLSKNSFKVLYVSGEESVQQTLQRAGRLNVCSENIELASESELHQIIDLTRKMKPDILIVDSIQTIYLPELDSAPGSVSQVRETAGRLMALAKNEGYSVILVGHVTKEGNIAGPKVLEHMVDTVLSFEGDLSFQFRLLRSLKNRFGPTHELGVFQMGSQGLFEVQNPSEIFLQERGESLIGSAVFPSLEGTRPLLCEIQALVSPTPLPMPRRTALGIDINRLHLLIAVTERHLNFQLFQFDIFVNVVGGLKLAEPACDLPLLAALLSSESRNPLDSKTCYMGEVGLTGEVRAVSLPEIRIKEAYKLGFRRIIMPVSNKKNLEFEDIPKDINIIYLKTIQDLKKYT
jgi:DNA repair protein RadA/Sms